MFTGLVEGLGTVRSLDRGKSAVALVISPPPALIGRDEAPLGSSIAVNGCCLTVVSDTPDSWTFEAGAETLSRTNLGALRPGDAVNLERALPADGRLGGHFVQGHVDGTAAVERVDRDDEWVTMSFAAPPELLRLLVSKGSVAIDGVSLTVVDVDDARFSIALIPHTLEVTTLGRRTAGDIVNIETDLIGKYVARLMESRILR